MITINFKDILYEDLPIDGQQVVTGVDLIVAGDLAGKKPFLISGNRFSTVQTPYIPLPAVHKYRHPDHDEYNYLKTVKLADYFDPFLPPTEVLGTGNGATLEVLGNFQPGDGTQIMDGDDETYLENKDEDGDALDIIYYYRGAESELSGKIIGWRLVYEATFSTEPTIFRIPQVVTMSHTKFTDADDVPPNANMSRTAYWTVDDTVGEKVDIYAVFPADIYLDQLNAVDSEEWLPWNNRIVLSINADRFLAPGTFRLYHFYPLILNSTVLENIAQAEVILPATRPGRIQVKGYVAADSVVKIEGFPGGNIVAVTKGFEYTHNRDQGLMTIISLEQDSIMSEADYGQRRRAIEEMINRKITRDGYSVLMGERL